MTCFVDVVERQRRLQDIPSTGIEGWSNENVTSGGSRISNLFSNTIGFSRSSKMKKALSKTTTKVSPLHCDRLSFLSLSLSLARSQCLQLSRSLSISLPLSHLLS